MSRHIIHCVDGQIETFIIPPAVRAEIISNQTHYYSSDNYNVMMKKLDENMIGSEDSKISSKIIINVRGKNIECDFETLSYLKYFDPILSGRWTLDKDIFIDIDSEAFIDIINFIKNPSMITIKTVSKWYKEMDRLCLCGGNRKEKPLELQMLVDNSDILDWAEFSYDIKFDDSSNDYFKFSIDPNIRFISGMTFTFVLNSPNDLIYSNNVIADPEKYLIKYINIFSGDKLITCFTDVKSLKKIKNLSAKYIFEISFDYLTKNNFVINNNLNFFVKFRSFKNISKNLLYIGKLKCKVDHIIFRSIYDQFMIKQLYMSKIKTHVVNKIKNDEAISVPANISKLYIACFNLNTHIVNIINSIELYKGSLLVKVINLSQSKRYNPNLISYKLDDKLKMIGVNNIIVTSNTHIPTIFYTIIFEHNKILKQSINLTEIIE